MPRCRCAVRSRGPASSCLLRECRAGALAVGAPCSKPPWATLDAVDLSSGRSHGAARWVGWALLRGWPLSRMDESAFSTIGGPLITATGLIFVGAGTDPAFRAYDLSTGKELWKATLPTGSVPMELPDRYASNGRQFVISRRAAISP